MTTYEKRKNEIRQKAIQWQHNFTNKNYFYSDLLFYSLYFQQVAKKYGLIKEFKENGII